MHPLVDDLNNLKDSELESRIQDLSKKYFQARNPSVQYQITMILDMYRAELSARQAKTLQQEYQKRDQDLDSLINVS